MAKVFGNIQDFGVSLKIPSKNYSSAQPYFFLLQEINKVPALSGYIYFLFFSCIATTHTSQSQIWKGPSSVRKECMTLDKKQSFSHPSFSKIFWMRFQELEGRSGMFIRSHLRRLLLGYRLPPARSWSLRLRARAGGQERDADGWLSLHVSPMHESWTSPSWNSGTAMQQVHEWCNNLLMIRQDPSKQGQFTRVI